MTNLRNYRLTLTGSATLITETCYSCGVLFAMTEDFRAHRLRTRDDFYCPNGHSQRYVGPTAEEKLKEAEARELALQDQLDASVRDAETTRQALLRDRERFANGVCPCCNRSFDNVRRHMATKHPEYDVAEVVKPLTFGCSCGRKFETLRGLRVHQGWQRPENWTSPSLPDWRRHLTTGARR